MTNMETLKVQMEELNNEEMYVWVAPDGIPQIATIAPDFPMCVAMAEMFATGGLCKSASVMWEEGFQILPVRVTISQNGDADKAFNDWKKVYGKCGCYCSWIYHGKAFELTPLKPVTGGV